jgi:hypothetical protein
MKKVKMINRVDLPDGKGGSYLPMEGDECDVTTSVAEALERGGDAEIIGDVKTETVAEVAKVPAKKASTKKKKNRGAAPENKSS